MIDHGFSSQGHQAQLFQGRRQRHRQGLQHGVGGVALGPPRFEVEIQPSKRVIIGFQSSKIAI